MKIFAPVLAVLWLAVAPLPAQDPETPVVTTRKSPDEVQAEEGATAGIEDEVFEASKAEGKPGLVDHQPSIRNDLAFYMAPIVGFQPRRIAPGQVGEASIVLSMQKGAVLQPGQLKVEYQREQGAVVLGEWTIDEPAPGLEDGPFRGQPVHESFARVTIPLQVKADAAHGKQVLMFELTAVVTDGATGSTRGESRGHARADLAIGPPLPTPGAPPAPVEARDRPAPEPVDDGADAPDLTAAPDRAAPLRAERGDAPPAAAGSADERAVPVGPADLPVADDGDSTMLLVGGGAGIVVLLVLLLGLRRR